MRWRVVAPGVCEAIYETSADSAVEKQAEFVQTIREQAKSGPVAMVVDTGPIRTVEFQIVNFWLGITRESPPPLQVVSVATSSLAVGIVARSFARTHALLGSSLRVDVHRTLAEAHTWAAGELAKLGRLPKG